MTTSWWYWLMILGWFVGLSGLSINGLGQAKTAWAQTGESLVVRAFLPQPETGEPEWVLIERFPPREATLSAEMSDTHGSTKTYAFAIPAQQQWTWLSATQSGVVLNNDQDAVELRVAGNLVDRSATFSGSKRGQVWTRLDEEWQWLPLADFWHRWNTDDWLSEEVISTASPSPNPELPLAGDEPPGGLSLGDRSPSALELEPDPQKQSGNAFAPEPFLGKPVTLLASHSAQTDKQSVGPPPEPDYATEKELYLQWKEHWRRGLFFFLAASVIWWGLGLPIWWRWLRQRPWRRMSWTLLS